MDERQLVWVEAEAGDVLPFAAGFAVWALVRSCGPCTEARDLPLYHHLPKVLGYVANAASAVAAGVAIPTRGWR